MELFQTVPRRVVVIAFTLFIWSQCVQSSTEPTPQLDEIFLGKCWEYIYVVNPEVGYKNCSDLWQKFFDSFAYKDPCRVLPEDYKSFAEAAQTPLPENRHMFWEETYEFVHRYSDKGKRAVSISDTLLGYMANELVWCGQVEEPGINYSNCTCLETDDAVLSYWKGVSSYFAANASGVTHVLLNGSIDDAFPIDGVFSIYELENLNPDTVDEVHALIVHEIGLPVKESCTNGSLIELKEKVEHLGFTYKCTDDRADLLHLMCVDYSDAPECTFLLSISAAISWKAQSLLVIVLLAIYASLTELDIKSYL